MPGVKELPLCTISEYDEKARTSTSRADSNAPAPETNVNYGSRSPPLRVPSYCVHIGPQSTRSSAQSLRLSDLILLPAEAYQPPGAHHNDPHSARPQSTLSSAQSLSLTDLVLLPAKAYQPPGAHHNDPSSVRPQSTLSSAQSLGLTNLVLLPAKAYRPHGTHHEDPSSARPESETIPLMPTPHGLNIRIDGEKRLSTLSLEDARCILATNPWQMERSHRPRLQNGRLLRSSILMREKPLPPLPSLPPPIPPDDDVSVGSSKQTLTEKIWEPANSPAWPVKGIPPEWSVQATKRISDERGSSYDMPGIRREITRLEESLPKGRPKLHRVSTIPNWVKDWRRSRAERNRYADSLEVLPACRESHLPDFVQPEDRPPDSGPRALLRVLGGFSIMLNTL